MIKKLAIVFSVLILTFIFVNSVSSDVKSIPTPSVTDTVLSSDNPNEFYIVETPLDEDNTVYVYGKTKINTYRFCIRISKHKSGVYSTTTFVTPNENGEFYIKINTSEYNYDTPEVIDDKGYVTQSYETWGSRPGYNAVENMTPGIYHLTIARATTPEDADVSPGVSWYQGSLGASNGSYAYKDFLLKVAEGENNNPKLIVYNDVIKNNESWQRKYESTTYMVKDYKGSYLRYRDKYLNDIAFVFKNPKTGVYSYLDSTKLAYIKNLSNSIVADAEDDYSKLEKIYEYITDNFYYDSLAFSQGKYQYSNPYLNLYNHENKIASANSDGQGRVATTCQGFASLVAALARVQDIPVRLVNGFHVSNPVTIYQDKTSTDLARTTHWWAEAYIDGKWIVIDANNGTNAKWTRSSFSDVGSWVNPGTSTYAGFDPKMEVLANNYIYKAIYKGSSSNYYIEYLDEFNKLKTFLNKKYLNTTNGKRLNSEYSQVSSSTWSNSTNLKTNGFGRVSYITWKQKSLYGTLNVSGFKALTYLNVGNNKITSLNISNCTALTNVQAYSNNITVFNSSTAPKLTTINLNSNKLYKATFKDGAKTITIKRNITKGHFSFKYTKANKKRIAVNVGVTPKNYKYLGIYRNGKKLTAKKQYSFNPSSTGTYYVKFASK